MSWTAPTSMDGGTVIGYTMLPAMAAGLVRVLACDPKLMELAFGRALFDRYGRYAADPGDIAALLEDAVADCAVGDAAIDLGEGGATEERALIAGEPRTTLTSRGPRIRIRVTRV